MAQWACGNYPGIWHTQRHTRNTSLFNTPSTQREVLTNYKFPCALRHEAVEFACPDAPGPASNRLPPSTQNKVVCPGNDGNMHALQAIYGNLVESMHTRGTCMLSQRRCQVGSCPSADVAVRDAGCWARELLLLVMELRCIWRC
jgi:hypothetical protein